MKCLSRYAMAVAALLFHPVLTAGAVAQDQEPARLQLRAVRTAQAPVIDGRLDEQSWSDAGRIDGLTQVQPIEGEPAQARTEVLVLYDDVALYLGFRCFDGSPERIVEQRMRRDGDVALDDRVEWVLDPFNENRNGYYFILTAAGGRRDEILSVYGLRQNPRWDANWEGRTAIHADGWSGEVAIPFSAISFQPGGDWGFNVQRFRGSGRVLDRWESPSRGYGFTRLGTAGSLTGIEDVEGDLGFEFRPYFKGERTYDAVRNDADWLGQFGGDLDWRIAPFLEAGITVNTDFAETEIDDLQVNLTRFPTFFPEKRDFFLADASLFDYGPVRVTRSPPDLLPYFSRTIGLVQGQEVPIDAGLRLAGHAGPVEIGLLGVRTGAAVVDVGGAALDVPRSDLLVFRPSVKVSRQLQLGAFLTAGDPTSDSAAQTLGVDARYWKKFADSSLGWNVYGMRSFDGVTDERDYAYGLQASYETDDWTAQYGHQAVGASFRPALGFLSRQAYHKHRLILRYEPQPEADWIRRFLYRFDPVVYTDLSNDVESYDVNLRFFGLELEEGDRFELTVSAEGDRPEVAFMPVPGSVIPAGEYDWLRGQVTVASSPNRPLSAAATFAAGEWYDDGSLHEILLEGTWRPSKHFRLSTRYLQNHADIPGGDFTTRIEQLNLDYLLDPDTTWENLVQSDNVSRTLGWQSRLRWIYEDSREFFLVLNSGWLDDRRSLVPVETDLTFKAVWAFRF